MSKELLDFFFDQVKLGHWKECDECPMGESVGYKEGVRSPDHHYDCQILGKEVWGGNPECRVEDWRSAIRKAFYSMELALEQFEPNLSNMVDELSQIDEIRQVLARPERTSCTLYIVIPYYDDMKERHEVQGKVYDIEIDHALVEKDSDGELVALDHRFKYSDEPMDLAHNFGIEMYRE